MFSTSKRDNIFFNYFVEMCKEICCAAEMLNELINNYTDVDSKIRKIEEKEHECDILVHNILEQLNKSFITPIDREDIFLIAKELDNIIDSIEAVGHRFIMLNVKEIRKPTIAMSDLIVKCTNALSEVMKELENMKKSTSMRDKVIEVNNIENDGDEIFRNAVSQLFRSESDAIEVIRWKEIYEILEDTLDACEDVANIVEGIVMKNA